MGALMVVDPQPAARYLPAEPYINRAAPKSKRGLKKKQREGGENEKTRRGRIKETHKTEIKKTVYRVKTETKASNKPRIPTLTSLSS